ncbi:MAG: AI-2E family transporter [Anaerolineaceae bacterium]|nr:AI-2E family transporter [Anaerolineaceae bacterium]
MIDKRALTYTAAFAVVVLAIFLLRQISEVVVYFLLSLVLGAVLRPLADFLRGKNRLLSVFVIAATSLILIGLGYALYLSFMLLSDELNLLVNTVSNLKQWYLPVWMERLSFPRTLIEMLPPPGQVFEIATTESGQMLLPFIQDLSLNLVSVLSGLVIVIFLALYWIGSEASFERLWLSLLSVEHRQKARIIWRKIDANLGDYGRHLLVRFFLTWLLISIGVYYLRSPYPILLGLLVALVNLLPIIGFVLAFLITLTIGLLSSILFYPWLLVYVLLVLALLNLFVWPKLYQAKWDVPILRLLFLLIIGETLGLRWILLAPALAVTLQILWDGVSSSLRMQKPLNKIESLQIHRQLLVQAVSDLEDLPPALNQNLQRLEELIEKSSQFLDPELSLTLPDSTATGDYQDAG